MNEEDVDFIQNSRWKIESRQGDIQLVTDFMGLPKGLELRKSALARGEAHLSREILQLSNIIRMKASLALKKRLLERGLDLGLFTHWNFSTEREISDLEAFYDDLDHKGSDQW